MSTTALPEAERATATAASVGTAAEPVAPPSPPAPVVTFTEQFVDAEAVCFQLIQLGQSSYVWIGTQECRQDSLAMGVPSAFGPPAAGTTLLGGGSAYDGVSQTMAQRLARKLGHPVFVSMNLRDDAELRFFAERHVLAALTGKRPAATTSAGAAAQTLPLPLPPKPASSAASSACAASAPTSSGTTAAVGADAGRGHGARVFDVFDSAETLGAAGGAGLLEAAREAIAARGVFLVALSGGSVPKLLSPSLLAAAASSSARFDCWHFFMADERYVPQDHPDSNMGEWRRTLLAPLGINPSQVHALDETIPLEQAARAYEANLVRIASGGRAVAAAAAGGPPPRLDAVVLGMGPDGHTASLFPDHLLLQETGCWVAPIADSPKPPPCRITLTFPVLNAASLVLFLVTGGSKAQAVRGAFAPEPTVPAGHVLASVRTHWLLDGPAASELLVEEEKQEHMYS